MVLGAEIGTLIEKKKDVSKCQYHGTTNQFCAHQEDNRRSFG